MKRCSAALVTYSSSDDDDDSEPPAKKRKLPSLSSSLAPNLPVDNPALHQGRIRTKAHVEGQFAAHVYVSLIVERCSPLHNLLDEILNSAKILAPTLTAFWSQEELIKERELHISLSRPIYLRAHQREELKKAVKSLSRRFPPFTVSFAAFSELTNDEKTRTFLAMEIGAGHHELQALSNALTPALLAIRQKGFYSDPQFHASIAWALLDRPSSMSRKESVLVPRPTSPKAHPEQVTDGAEFPTIPHFPKELIPTLNNRHGVQLASPKTGTFHVEEVTVKIGKELCTWKLSAL